VSWLETAAIVFGLLGFAAMGAVLAFRIYRNPFLLAGLLPIVWAHVKPVLMPMLARLFRRLDEPTEKAWRDCVRRGGKWNYHKRRCE
jgi:hypothetical protein